MFAQSEALAEAGEPSSLPVPVVGDDGIRGLTDPDLLVQLSRGDLDALAVIYDRHIEAAWKVALHFSEDAAAAEEAVSAVFLRLWRNPEPNHQTVLVARLMSSVTHECPRFTTGSERTTHEHQL